MLRTIIYFHVYIILDFNENTYTKGRALMQMYRVVPITKKGNCFG